MASPSKISGGLLALKMTHLLPLALLFVIYGGHLTDGLCLRLCAMDVEYPEIQLYNLASKSEYTLMVQNCTENYRNDIIKKTITELNLTANMENQSISSEYSNNSCSITKLKMTHKYELDWKIDSNEVFIFILNLENIDSKKYSEENRPFLNCLTLIESTDVQNKMVFLYENICDRSRSKRNPSFRGLELSIPIDFDFYFDDDESEDLLQNITNLETTTSSTMDPYNVDEVLFENSTSTQSNGHEFISMTLNNSMLSTIEPKDIEMTTSSATQAYNVEDITLTEISSSEYNDESIISTIESTFVDDLEDIIFRISTIDQNTVENDTTGFDMDSEFKIDDIFYTSLDTGNNTLKSPKRKIKIIIGESINLGSVSYNPDLLIDLSDRKHNHWNSLYPSNATLECGNHNNFNPDELMKYHLLLLACVQNQTADQFHALNNNACSIFVQYKCAFIMFACLLFIMSK